MEDWHIREIFQVNESGNEPLPFSKSRILLTFNCNLVPRLMSGSVQWVAEGSPQHSSTPVKIESALQFVPINTNPKEFKKLQQQVSLALISLQIQEDWVGKLYHIF